MLRLNRWIVGVCLAGSVGFSAARAQIDPFHRELIQMGYNLSFQGHPPLAFYAYYYHNHPEFLRTNLTLRLALAPTYLDSELGIREALGPRTDLGIGLAGGGFADSYDEIRSGTFIPSESFVGHGGVVSLSLYHCFNPDDMVPLNGVLRGAVRYATYESDDTVPKFILPENQGSLEMRAGLRWGGKEPVLYPSLTMELSAWYEVRLRADAGGYGFRRNDGFDRAVNPRSHLIWGAASLAYTWTNSGQSVIVNLVAGDSIETDRFSAYRLGALLPLVSEFPLSLPGYYYQEISADKFVLLGGNYIFPLDDRHQWNLNLMAATAAVDYLPGLQQPGHWLSGVGGGIQYQSSSLKIMVGYAYGVDAIRTGGRGAHSIGVLMQVDLDRAQAAFRWQEPGQFRGFQRIFGTFK